MYAIRVLTTSWLTLQVKPVR